MDNVTEAVVFTVTNRIAGYAHVTLHGTYTGPATVDDVKKKFYHSYFGGRGAWCHDGEFGCVVHTD
jgi:hypothetical protein